jgi:hypothetical protein
MLANQKTWPTVCIANTIKTEKQAYKPRKIDGTQTGPRKTLNKHTVHTGPDFTSGSDIKAILSRNCRTASLE